MLGRRVVVVDVIVVVLGGRGRPLRDRSVIVFLIIVVLTTVLKLLFIAATHN